MAIYRIFPTADTTIYSDTPLANTGLDEILELGYYRDVNGVNQSSRILIKYDISDINLISSLYNNNQEVSASLNLYLADAYELPLSFEIDTFPVNDTWDTGRGKYGDIPLDTTGVSWVNRLYNKSGSWDTTGSFTGVTSSFSNNLVRGGGTWYYEVSGSSVHSSASFTPRSDLDLSLDLSKIIKLQRSGSISNNGVIIKLSNDIEKLELAPNIRLKYFGVDTNTIYPPFIEIKWNDFSYQTGSLNLLNSSISDIKISNNRGVYSREEKIKFRLFCRPKYPQRTFSTSSVYTVNHALPTSTVWGLRDEHSNDYVVKFDSNFTKVSCDAKGPYFTMYMNSLQPERYYRLLLKTELDGSDIVIDTKENIFKLTRNV